MDKLTPTFLIKIVAIECFGLNQKPENILIILKRKKRQLHRELLSTGNGL